LLKPGPIDFSKLGPIEFGSEEIESKRGDGKPKKGDGKLKH
jgi:hypothetical protein